MAVPLLSKNGAGRTRDVEKLQTEDPHAVNDTVHTLSWSKIAVTVKDKQSKQSRDLLHNVNGHVKAGK